MIPNKLFAGKTLAILSGGGDTPAINSSIEYVRNRASMLGYKVYGILRGWKGLLGDGDLVDLTNIPYNGIYGGTVAFETKDGYLKWSSGNSLDVDDEINANSSWIVNLSNDVYTVINFATFSTNSERYLKGNMGANPKRFACYTSGQTAISFEQVGADPDRAAAVAFAESFMTAIECHDNGATAPTYNTSWADLATAYEALSTNAKDLFINGHADKDTTDKIEQALALYDLLVSKYELTEFITGRVINSAIAPVSANNNNASFVAVIVVVSVIALASVATITTIVIVKRKFYR